MAGGGFSWIRTRVLALRGPGQEIQRVEVETRPPTTDLVATLEASLGRKELAKATPPKSEQEQAAPSKRPARRRRAS
jgi:hypothetical protein